MTVACASRCRCPARAPPPTRAPATSARTRSRRPGKQWESAYNYPREDQQLEHQLVLGGQLSLEELMAIPARSDERGEAWLETEPSRFARLADRLWSGLLIREELAIR